MKKSPGKRGRERRAVSSILPALAQGRADTNIRALQGVTERLLTADAGRGPSLGAVLQSLFQFLHVPRCPPLCLPLRDERDEQPADPVTPKVELVRDARPATVVERLDGASVFSSDGAVKAANGEASWRVELRNLDGHVLLAPTYATRHDRARPDRDGAFADPLGADDTPLPFGQMRRVRNVREYIFGASRDLDARNDGCHCLPPSGRRNIDDSASGDRALWPRRRPPASRKGIARSRDTRGMGARPLPAKTKGPANAPLLVSVQ